MLIFKWVLCAGLIGEIAIAPKLWSSAHGVPAIPLIDGVPDLPPTVTLLFSFLWVLAVGWVAWRPHPRSWTYSVPAIAGFLVLFDINRLQPWLYQYGILFCILGWQKGDAKRAKSAWSMSVIVLLATYFWSGVQKLNMTFATFVFPSLLRPLGLGRISSFWMLGPILESSIAVLLFFPRTRKLGIWTACGMHLFLLLVLGPFGQNANAVVWPWNICMPAMVLVLLVGNVEPVFRDTWKPLFGKAVVVLVGAMPAFSFVGWWDTYLSSSLYSGKESQGYIVLTEDGANHLPLETQKFLQRSKGHIGLDITRWYMAEIGVPVFPEVRVYKAIANKLIGAGVPEGDVKLVVLESPSVLKLGPRHARDHACPSIIT